VSKGRRDNDFLRHQARARQAAKAQLLARQGEKELQQQQAKAVLQQLITQTMAQQQRLARLAPAFAERCGRVHELLGLYRVEWERAQRLQVENEELRARVEELELPTSGNDAAPQVISSESLEWAGDGGGASGLAAVIGNGEVVDDVYTPPIVP